jgi:hypothetical protein
MTALRPISLPAHAAVELTLGALVMAAPFLLGFGSAGTVVALTTGAVILGLALSAADPSGSVAAHHAGDQAMAIALLGAALVLGLAGDAIAVVCLGAAGAVQLALNTATRYSARP